MCKGCASGVSCAELFTGKCTCPCHVKFEVGKEYWTRNKDSRVKVLDINDQYIVGVYTFGNLVKRSTQRRLDGTLYSPASPHAMDLRCEYAPKKVLYVNICSDGEAYAHPSRRVADNAAAKGRIACVRVEYEKGQRDE